MSDVTRGADGLGRWLAACVDELAAQRARIDSLNVFPVPDGDTGTNLLLTAVSAWQGWDDASRAGSTLHEMRAAASRSAMRGARGNSGVIWAQWLHGFLSDADGQGGDVSATGPHLHECLSRARDEAYRSVADPVEGTMLTVATAAAAGAMVAAAGGGDSWECVRAALDEARTALDRTPEQLPVLKRAGVVDAGGAGLVVVLEALLAAKHAERSPSPLPDSMDVSSSHAQGACSTAPATGEYEVMFMLCAEAGVKDDLVARLSGLGNSLAVVGSDGEWVGSDGEWKVHIHSRLPGSVIDLAVESGAASDFHVTYLEPSPLHQSALQQSAPHVQRADGPRGLVAVAHGPGAVELLTAAGAVIVHGRPHQRPSVGEFVDAIRATGAAEVVILPSDKDSRASAEIAATHARGDGVRVAVIPTRSIMQTISAIAVHDQDVGFDADVAEMAASAGATRYAGVTVASRNALTSAGPCAIGDVLGVVDGDIVVVGREVLPVAREIIDRMLAMGGDLVTVLLGAEAEPTVGEQIDVWMRREHPLADIVCHVGGQPLWPIIIGVE